MLDHSSSCADGPPFSVLNATSFLSIVTAVVVNAALNDDFIGAKLVYSDLVRGECARLWTPERALGDVTVHDCTTVHGVSRLAAGVRYNMYIVFEAALTSAAA